MKKWGIVIVVFFAFAVTAACEQSDTSPGLNTGADADSDDVSDTDTDSDVDTDTDLDSDTDSDIDADTDADLDADLDSDSDTDTGSGSDADTDADTDTATDMDTDTGCVDEDDDEWCVEFDCDDNNADINPDVEEIEDNSVDDDCDGMTDEIDVEASCRAVDVVIAVDPSGSMEEELQAFRDTVFPAFAEHLQNLMGTDDSFRIATLDSCPTPANFHTSGTGGECSFWGGNVWIESASPTMLDEFSCVGDINTTCDCTGNNDDEQPASAAGVALNPPWSTAQNTGFIRNSDDPYEDAVLVVIAITDEDELPTGTPQTAQEIVDQITAAKGGDILKTVFFGIGAESLTSCSSPYGTPMGEAVLLKQITDIFSASGRGIWRDLCDGDIEDGLDEVFEIIEQACLDLVT